MINEMDSLVDRLIAGHDGGPLVESVPDHLVPVDLPHAYSVQDLIISKLGPVGGWKVMAGGQGEPLCAPIPSARYFNDGATLRARHHNLVLTEIEVGLRLGKDVESDASVSDIDGAIAALLPAIEMVGSPFVDRDAIAFNAKLADLQSNGAVVVGADFAGAIKSELPTLPVSLDLDGRRVAEAGTGASYGDILNAVAWLASHAAGRGMPLRAGQVIITGSRILRAQGEAATISGIFGQWGTVTAQLGN